MPKKNASKKSPAMTQPKFKTNEVTIKGKDVILSGELAAEVQHWLQTKNTSPVSTDVTLVSVLGGFVGAPLGKQVSAKISLPADLMAWAKDEAYNQEGELSDLVRELLQFERYRWERLCTYSRIERK